MNTRSICSFCLLLLLLSTAAHARIVFLSERNGVEGVYVMDDDGSNQTLLTDKFDPTYPAGLPTAHWFYLIDLWLVVMLFA